MKHFFTVRSMAEKCLLDYAAHQAAALLIGVLYRSGGYAWNGLTVSVRRRPVRTPFIRYELARCSLELFIACEVTERNAKLSSRIGENAHLLSDGEVQEMVRALLKG